MKVKSLYIASLEKNSGSLLVAIGLMQYLKAKYTKVAFYRPIIKREDSKDSDIKTIVEHFSLDIKYEKTFSFYVDELENSLANNSMDQLYEKVVLDVESLQKEYDFVLISGISKDIVSTTIDFDINLQLAKNINVSLVAILNGKNKSFTTIQDELEIENKNISKSNINQIATFVNRVDPDTIKDFQQKATDKKAQHTINFLPEIPQLDTLTIGQIKKDLKAKLVFGDKNLLEKQIGAKKVAAMRAEHFIRLVQKNDLVIVPADRTDIILALSSIYYTHNFPHISAVVLTGGITLDPIVLEILKGLDNFSLPFIQVDEDTFSTVQKIEHIKTTITHKDKSKIATIIGSFSRYVQMEKIEQKLADNFNCNVTPVMFKHKLLQKALQQKQTIVLPESEDERILRATAIITKANIANIVLLGGEKTIEKSAKHFDIDISKVTIIDPNTSPLTKKYAKEFQKIRAHKHITYEQAYDTIKNDMSYFATMMVEMNDSDGMVSGAVNTTANTVRPALQIIKTKPTSDVVSSLFFMAMDREVLIYADCAINTNPTAEQLASIAIDTAQNGKAFDMEPKIAMLSYSTCDSGSGCDVDKVKLATKIVKQKRPDLAIEGPIQYDAAIDKSIAKKKLPNSCVAGEANIFIFPDLNTGNNTYKAVRDASSADAIGPILQGLNKPVNDLSRGCSVEDIVNTVIITSIQSTMQKGKK